MLAIRNNSVFIVSFNRFTTLPEVYLSDPWYEPASNAKLRNVKVWTSAENIKERCEEEENVKPVWESDFSDCWRSCEGKGGECASDECRGYCCSPDPSKASLNGKCPQDQCCTSSAQARPGLMLTFSRIKLFPRNTK